MFRQRLITILVLMPLVLLALYFANLWMFASVLFLFVLLSGIEWVQLIPLRNLAEKSLFIVLLFVAVGFSYYWLSLWLFVGLISWAFILVALLFFPASQKIWGRPWVVIFAAFVLLPLFAIAFLNLFQFPQGKPLIVYLLAIVWSADIGAYLVGKWGGRNKLIPKVSPGKTYEGALGGFLAGLLIAFVGYTYFKPANGINWFILAAATIVISIVGDLFISMLKRRQKLKDTGHLFPGHGGVLDRIDSLIAALPLFYFGLLYFPVGI